MTSTPATSPFKAVTQASDARKSENAQRRAAARANAELCAVLLQDARRRGGSEIDWPEYFRNTYMAD